MVAVVPVYNHPATIGAVVRGILGHGLPCILVDDGSDAACEGVLRRIAAGQAGRVTLLRLPPNSPFATTNFLMAATRVPLAAYLLGTLAGMAPRTAAVVYFGSGLSQLDLKNHASLASLAVSLVLTIIVIAVIGRLANQALAKVTAAAAPHR